MRISDILFRRHLKLFMIFLTVTFAIYMINASFYSISGNSKKLPLVFLILFLLLYIYKNIKKINIVVILFVSFLVYLFWGMYASVTPFSDFLGFYRHSVKFADTFSLSVLYSSKSPTTVVYYSIYAFFFGNNYLSFYIGSSLIWSAQIVLLFKSLVNFQIIENKAKFISLMYGFYPGIVFYATVVSRE